MLVDIGSTTTDLIAFRRGQVLTTARSDAQRLASGELAADDLNCGGGIAGRPVELVAVDAGRSPDEVAAEVAGLAERW